jgi:hypothetical protein
MVNRCTRYQYEIPGDPIFDPHYDEFPPFDTMLERALGGRIITRHEHPMLKELQCKLGGGATGTGGDSV